MKVSNWIMWFYRTNRPWTLRMCTSNGVNALAWEVIELGATL